MRRNRFNEGQQPRNLHKLRDCSLLRSGCRGYTSVLNLSNVKCFTPLTLSVKNSVLHIHKGWSLPPKRERD